jgi:hypothetical protein
MLPESGPRSSRLGTSKTDLLRVLVVLPRQRQCSWISVYAAAYGADGRREVATDTMDGSVCV